MYERKNIETLRIASARAVPFRRRTSRGGARADMLDKHSSLAMPSAPFNATTTQRLGTARVERLDAATVTARGEAVEGHHIVVIVSNT
jgi:hypothetical protein